jgi:NAD-dependent deacetylase
MEIAPELLARLARAGRVVVFTGAGVSQESGLETFRDAEGLWRRFRPEDLATPEAFEREPDRVWRWYAGRFAAACRAEPNPAHRVIARWAARFPSLLVVTQNVDGLHQRAGSPEVVELHGSLARCVCARCGAERPTAELVPAGGSTAALPAVACDCGGRFRPAVVWFGEALPAGAMACAADAAAACDALLSVGTSARVWPAASLIEIAAAAGALVLEVNREPSALSALAAAQLLGAAGEVLPALDRELDRWRSPS